MSSTLPVHPSLEQLKKQAKDLRRTFGAGQPEALARVRQHLPRLSEASDEELQRSELALKEAQHVIARELGYRHWEWLRAVVEVDLEPLARLSDDEAARIRSQLGQGDLAAGLVGASSAVRERMLSRMVPRIRAFVESEIEFRADADPERVREAGRRMMQQAADLAAGGEISWPDGRAPAPPPVAERGPEERFDADPRLRQLLGRELDDLSEDDLVALWRRLAEEARREGVLVLHAAEALTASTFIREAIELAVNGTSPDLLQDLLWTRSHRALLPARQTRGLMVIEGLLSILHGDNPLIVRHKLTALHLPGPGAYTPEPTRQVADDEMASRLQRRPYWAMAPGELSALLVDLALLRRRRGTRALCELTDSVACPLLRRGLELTRDGADDDRVLDALAKQLDEDLAQTGARHSMVIAAVEAVQGGQHPADLERAMRRAAASPVPTPR